MQKPITITSVEFKDFKAFLKYNIKFHKMNILVGPNNCGKSTIINAFRILALGIRQALHKRPSVISISGSILQGYSISEETLPMSIENIHTDYVATDTTVSFRLSNGNKLILLFPKSGGSYLITESQGRPISTPSAFRREYPITVDFVPVLGPVEHREAILTEETVRRNLATHKACRHFRNYWRYNPDNFQEFAELVKDTWPGMEVERPHRVSGTSELAMFCLENRMTREIYWAGFGFQIWCQLLTHIARAKKSTILIVDEPEIYLHPDVQRQLLNILRYCGPDIIIATHSAEIMGEADASEILLVDKGKNAAERLRDIEGVQAALDAIGSVQNITLTQLARTRNLLFFEGPDDFKIIRRFARKLGFVELASGNDITILTSGGFSAWERIKSLAWGFKSALKTKIRVGAIFDRDYWSREEGSSILSELNHHLELAHIHERKEIENYLLEIPVLERAFLKSLSERSKCSSDFLIKENVICKMLDRITSTMKSRVQAQYIAKRSSFLCHAKEDSATVTTQTITLFDRDWNSLDSRMSIVPGKEVLSLLRTEVRNKYSVNLSDYRIIDEFRIEEIPADIKLLIEHIEEYRVGLKQSATQALSL
ncbi:hypothetical protein AXX12_17160 [Anaerosporomusa subterranea]|uniref:ATPase AAA-type core domain-containing protein n=1 Tax=Anaerosporomusa subterranea TaxID=1794912 RepID=A0A154BUU2_ANASB|nr:ATP-binding protein [Anaerosporomusa subterranea]KYZ77794.1 hypothetical protein AXX12_17160 [Anaerosporomusa subterranea]